jgi:glycosyltransferase involved in cell wall biosynthesis
MPVYNAERYLCESLRSAFSQSLTDIEVIAIDDGSPDTCPQILREYAQAEPRLRIFTQENLGVFAARNRGFRAARGEFIAFLDPDDCYPDGGVLADLYTAAKANSVKICGGSWSKLAGGTLITQFAGADAKFSFPRDGMIAYRNYQFDFGYQRFIFRRDFLLEHGLFFPPYRRYQDPPFFVRAMLAAGEFYALRRVSYQYRWGHQNVNWDKARTLALLDGLTEVLGMANENRLAELHRLTICRALRDLPRTLAANLSAQNPKILERLLRLERMIRPEYYPNGDAPSIAPLILGVLRLREKEIARLGGIRSSMIYRAEEVGKRATKRAAELLRRSLPHGVKARLLKIITRGLHE